MTDAAAVAAVDCGTNSTRLLVVDADGAALDRQMRITRLGEGVDATRRLSPAAVERTLSVLRDYRRSMDDHRVDRARVVATSAVRDARDADMFMSAAAGIMGSRPEVLSGEEEGQLSFAGATASLPPEVTGSGRVLVVDIGGGSTELVVGQPASTRAATGLPAPSGRSLDIGCVRVSERFLRHDPPRQDEIDEARVAVTKEVRAARSALPTLGPDGLLVGLAGTVSTLTCLEHRITVYERDRVHHSLLLRDSVERWLSLLSAEDAPARLTRPGMAQGREDVIVGGILVLAVVMEVFGREECLVSEDDILDGLAAGLLDSVRDPGG